MLTMHSWQIMYTDRQTDKIIPVYTLKFVVVDIHVKWTHGNTKGEIGSVGEKEVHAAWSHSP